MHLNFHLNVYICSSECSSQLDELELLDKKDNHDELEEVDKLGELY